MLALVEIGSNLQTAIVASSFFVVLGIAVCWIAWLIYKNEQRNK